MMEEHAPPVNTKPITASATTIADEKIPFKEQQQPTEERDMSRNGTTIATSSSSSSHCGGDTVKDDGANANPLFKLVDAAASILQPENKTPQQEELKEEQNEEQTEQEQTQARDMTTNDAKSSTCTPSQQVPVQDKTADINNNIEKSDDTNKPKDDITGPSSAPASPNNANVLKGTKEDLLLDPKIKISFAEHLYNVLEDKEHDDVLQWMPDGKSFTVVNHKKFVLQKMPTLFSIRNMSSFVRKLGRWGFSRVFEKETNNSDVFKHPKFMRDDRAGVRKHVKCLGRAANNAKAQQQLQNANNNAMHPHHLPRQPDFVVCQEPGKAPVVLPNTPTAMGGGGGGGRTLHPHAAAMMMNAYHSNHHHPHHPTPFGTRTLVGGGGASFMAGPPPPLSPSCLDEVANASAASAEALYLSHQQQQKAKMEQLAAEQQRLEDLEIERLMKRREMRQQQQQQQQRMFMADHHQHHQQQQQQRLPPSSSSSPRMTAATSTAGSALMMMGNAAAASSSPSLDASMRSQQSLPPQQPLHAVATINNAMDLRRVSMQHGSASLDGSLGRSTSSRYSMHSATAAAVAADHQQQQQQQPPHVTPTYDTRKVLSAAYETLQRDEMRSRERQAAIRALLAEEQEFEARRRRVAYSGSSASASASAAPSATTAYMRG